MSRTFLDGNYLIQQVAGPPDYVIPFATNPVPYIYIMTYWGSGATFDLPIGSPGPHGGFYVGLVPGSFKAIGGGVYEYKREFAIVPNTRNEYESFVYSYQFYFVTDDKPSIEDVPVTVHSRLQFDYFLTDDPSTIDLPHAPRAIIINGHGFLFDGFGTFQMGEEILATDSTFKIWKPGIYERQMRFIKINYLGSQT